MLQENINIFEKLVSDNKYDHALAYLRNKFDYDKLIDVEETNAITLSLDIFKELILLNMCNYAMEFMKKEFPDMEECIFQDIMRGIAEKYNIKIDIQETDDINLDE